MANCPECGAEFTPPVNESKTKQAIRQIAENRQKLRRKISSQPKMELHQFLK